MNFSKNKKSPTSINVSSKASAELLYHLPLYWRQLDHQSWPQKCLRLMTMRLFRLVIELIERLWICPKNNKSKNSTCMPNIGATEEPNLLFLNAKKAFNHLRLAFIEFPILQHFNPEVISGLKLMYQAMP